MPDPSSLPLLAGALTAGAVLGLLLGRALGRRALLAERDAARCEASAARSESEAAREDALASRAAYRGLQDGARAAEAAFESVAATVLERTGERLAVRLGELATTRLEATTAAARAEHARGRQSLDALVRPLADGLHRLEDATRRLEVQRTAERAELRRQYTDLVDSTEQLRAASHALQTALRGSSRARGRWGEMALRNAVEAAGLTEHCDFDEQPVTDGGLRPDMVVHLPDGGALPVDAKVNLEHYLRAGETSDPQERERLLKAHAASLREEVRQLARRDYPRRAGDGPGLVVLFVPGEPVLAAAFEGAPDLLDDALARDVLLATPVTLVALLKTVGLGWRQVRLERNAREAQAAARELLGRVRAFGDRLGRVGRGLRSAVDGYNDAVGSWTARVLPAGRRLEGLGVADEQRLTGPDALATEPRRVPEDEAEPAPDRRVVPIRDLSRDVAEGE